MKVQLSEQTKKYKKIRNWLFLASLLLLFGPVIYFLCEAAVLTLAGGTTVETVAKVSIFSSSLLIFGILTIISVARKVVFKSSLWILVIAIYLILDYALYAVIVIGITQILDELVVSPLIKHYQNLIVINKEIDKRG